MKIKLFLLGLALTLATLLFWAIGPLIQNWPFLIRNSAFNVVVVACLTWLAMPLLTRVLNRWLQPEPRITR